MGGGEMKYIEEAFRQNWLAPLGPNVDNFEKDISNYLGVEDVAVLSSGTAAIHLALIILGIEKDDEVIASSFTFSATINPIVYQGATPVLVDSDQDTWNMSTELLRFAIEDRIEKGKKPKAIIPVHLYGMPANLDQILDLAAIFEIPVIEDAAEAFGSKYREKLLGTFGEIGIFSFNGNKIITTSGGGALISKKPDVVKKARFLASQARENFPYYQHSQIGYNYRISNVLAGIGRGQIEIVEDRIRKRRENFFFYKKNLKDIEAISFLQEPDNNYFSNHWLTTITIDPDKSEISPALLMSELEKANIETRFLWKPMHLQPVFKSVPAYLNGVSEKLFTRGICLPSGSNLSVPDLERIVENILRCFKRID
jgi:dTDP-4-amino-4,6-dideoxygalactose transaminase